VFFYQQIAQAKSFFLPTILAQGVSDEKIYYGA
jgi:hypothetical protein